MQGMGVAAGKPLADIADNDHSIQMPRAAEAKPLTLDVLDIRTIGEREGSGVQSRAEYASGP